ncbi:MAG: NAD(P)/FAD-dependent oxidoreductase [Acidimicrobiales bacterium]
MPAGQTFVIVGASLAGAKAAETLRDEGFDGRVVLIGEEAVRPYERPPLSKDYLRGEKGFEDAAVHPESFYSERDIELRTSTVAASLDVASKVVVLGGGERLGYDRLLISTGAEPRRLTIEGSELQGIRYLRSVSDADVLHEALTGSPHVVVIGAGWIGCEVAASARQLGAEVTMVEIGSVPLERVLGREVGEVYRDLHLAHGVDMRLEAGIEAFVGSSAVEGVRLVDGTVLSADVVVVGVGVTPRTSLAVGAGLEVDNGIVVDERLKTSREDIWAAGDVANALHPRYRSRIRLEHWSAALNQGPVAAKNMLGSTTSYDRTPYFFSDQYDVGMEYRGWAPVFDEVVIRGDVVAREFIAFWLREGSALAAMNVNIWDQGDAIEALLKAERPVDPAKLADPAVDLSEV